VLGVLLGLSAALGFGSSPIFARLGLQHMRTPALTFFSLVAGTVAAMSIAFVLHGGEIMALSPLAFPWFLLAGAIAFSGGRVLNYIGVSLVGVSRATPIVGASPLFAAALAITIGGETMNLLTMLGTASILGGLTLILSQR
jgi:drug/metabolite transporter (DMT)-like permease